MQQTNNLLALGSESALSQISNISIDKQNNAEADEANGKRGLSVT